jgi:hypothetical protein
MLRKLLLVCALVLSFTLSSQNQFGPRGRQMERNQPRTEVRSEQSREKFQKDACECKNCKHQMDTKHSKKHRADVKHRMQRRGHGRPMNNQMWMRNHKVNENGTNQRPMRRDVVIAEK